LLGQIFTPAPVADLALSLALETVPPGGRVLDPACGDGAFLRRARARGVPIDGIEIDPRVAGAAGAGVQVADFLATAPPGRLYHAVVGNPPYVRQELLSPAVKDRLAALVPDRRADLAIGFVAHALSFLAPGGRLAFVLSQAALDADYAEALRELLDGRARLLAVVASAGERWFVDAALHGAIVVLEAGAPRPGDEVRFARLDRPVAEAAARVRGLADLDAVARVRRVPAAEARRAPWGPHLRAADAWFEVAAAAGPALVPLGELAELWRGATSGANEFFYPPADAGIERRFLVPLLRSPRGTARIAVEPETLPRAFTCDLELGELPPGARAWVRAHAHLAHRPTLRARPRWWSLGARPARVFLTKAYDARFRQPLAPRPLLCDQRLYALEPRQVDPELMAAVLNATWTAFALESLGRASMGEGALEWSVADARRLPVVDPRRLAGRDGPVRAAFRRLAARAVGTAAEEAARPDRRALDEAIAAAVAPLRPLVAGLGGWHAAAVAERLARATATATTARSDAPAR
jgi:hypothetical protein